MTDPATLQRPDICGSLWYDGMNKTEGSRTCVLNKDELELIRHNLSRLIQSLGLDAQVVTSQTSPSGHAFAFRPKSKATESDSEESKDEDVKATAEEEAEVYDDAEVAATTAPALPQAKTAHLSQKETMNKMYSWFQTYFTKHTFIEVKEPEFKSDGSKNPLYGFDVHHPVMDCEVYGAHMNVAITRDALTNVGATIETVASKLGNLAFRGADNISKGEQTSCVVM